MGILLVVQGAILLAKNLIKIDKSFGRYDGGFELNRLIPSSCHFLVSPGFSTFMD
jgi:hypothetical protein